MNRDLVPKEDLDDDDDLESQSVPSISASTGNLLLDVVCLYPFSFFSRILSIFLILFVVLIMVPTFIFYLLYMIFYVLPLEHMALCREKDDYSRVRLEWNWYLTRSCCNHIVMLPFRALTSLIVVLIPCLSYKVVDEYTDELVGSLSPKFRVIRLKDVREWDSLEKYERGKTFSSIEAYGKIAFISHKWEGKNPDPNGEVLKCLKELYRDRKTSGVEYAFVDYCCTDQDNLDFKSILSTIESIPDLKLFKKIDHPLYDSSAWCTIEQCVFKKEKVKPIKMRALRKDRLVIFDLLETSAEDPKLVWEQIEWMEDP